VPSANETFMISSDSLAYFAVGSVPTNGAQESRALSSGREPISSASDWSALIDGQLASWAHHPAQLKDDDVLAPSVATIRKASLVAASLRDRGAPSPTRVVPTGDGGIALQFERGREFISIEIEPEGLVELLVFEEGRLKHRAAL
jgi:hypothetical protein